MVVKCVGETHVTLMVSMGQLAGPQVRHPQVTHGMTPKGVHDVFSKNQCPFEMLHSEP